MIHCRISVLGYYLLSAIALFTLNLAPNAHGKTHTLTIMTWQHYIEPDIVKQWETKTGNTIKFIYYDEEYQRDLLLIDAEELKIDIVLMNTSPIESLAEANIIAKIDEDKVPNAVHINPTHRQHCSDYAIPYTWGSLGIAYRKKYFKTPPSSWRDIFLPRPDLANHIGMLRDMEYPFSAVLKMLGHPINTSNQEYLKQAYDVLIKQAPKVLTYDYAISFLETGFQAHDLHMSLVYSGDHRTLNLIEGEDIWDYIIPKEGTTFWMDCWAFLNSSNNKALAYDFINFINIPEIAAKNSEHIYVATSNTTGHKLQSLEFKADRTVYPENQIIESSEFINTVKPKDINVRRKMLRAVLKAHESK